MGKAGIAKDTINYERGKSDVEDEHLDRNVFFDRGYTAGLIDKPMQAGRLPIGDFPGITLLRRKQSDDCSLLTMFAIDIIKRLHA